MATPTILQRIIEVKMQRVQETITQRSLDEITERASNQPLGPSFFDAMKRDGLSIIGEIKKASPSKGVIRQDFDPLAIAQEYLDSVDAISVLTEEDFFQGSDQILQDVAQQSPLPILRKDFIISPYQIYEARALGASAVLLIVSALNIDQLAHLLQTTQSMGMDALVEVHTEDEAHVAKDCGAKIIGINNRNLHTFNVDLNVTEAVASMIKGDCCIISESGIRDEADIRRLRNAGVDGVLIGETFMRCDDIAGLARRMKDVYAS